MDRTEFGVNLSRVDELDHLSHGLGRDKLAAGYDGLEGGNHAAAAVEALALKGDMSVVTALLSYQWPFLSFSPVGP